MASIELRHVSKSFGAHPVLKDITFAVKRKAFIVIAGPSGCGKSTLLNVIAGFLLADHGDILINSRSVLKERPSKRRIAMVFQEAALFPHMSVYDNIVYGLTFSGASQESCKEECQKIASLLHIEHLLERKAEKLSGGEKQRVSIARALIRKPDIFLMDEPFSSLDTALRNQLRVELMQMYQKMDATFLYVTHDQREAMTMADELLLMKDGTICQMGKPQELYYQPTDLFAASFLGKYELNCFDGLLEGTILSCCEKQWRLQAFYERCEVMIGVREHAIYFCEDGFFCGEVILIEQFAEEWYAHVLWNGKIIVIKDVLHQSEKGQKKRFAFCLRDALLFDKRTKQRLLIDPADGFEKKPSYEKYVKR